MPIDDPFEFATEMRAELSREVPRLRLLDRYYRGRQPAEFLHPEIAQDVRGRIRPLRINWPRVVLDAILERLTVTGFRVETEGEPDADLWAMWQRSSMDLRHKMAMRGALKHGRSALLVWSAPDDPSRPVITVESAKRTKWYRDPVTDEVEGAIKAWSKLGTDYLTIYLPDRVLRLRSTPDPAIEGDQRPRVPGWYLRVDGEVENPLGVCPVVPMVNRPDLDDDDWDDVTGSRDPLDMLLDPGEGESEMADVLDPADAVNKLATDLMVTAEYYAIPRRWGTGMEPVMRPPKTDAEREANTTDDNPDGWVQVSQWEQIAHHVWTHPDAEAKFGQFPEAELTNYTNAINLPTGMLAALGKLPPHYVGLFTAGNPASADAIRSAEASLVSTAGDRMTSFEDSIETAMRYAHRIRTGEWDERLQALETIWKNPETRTVAQQADAAVKLKQADIIDAEQAQEDVGYSPTARQRMAERRQKVVEQVGMGALAAMLNPQPSPALPAGGGAPPPDQLPALSG